VVFPARDPRNKIAIKKNHRSGPYGIRYAGRTADIPYCTELSEDNKKISFNKRLNPVLPKGRPEMFAEIAGFALAYLVKHFKPLPFVPFGRDVFEEWLAFCSHYNDERKFKLRRCFDKVEAREFYLRFCDYYGECFVKREFYPEPKCLRFINSRSDSFKALIGPYIHMIEKQVYKDEHFVKGTRIDELPQKLVILKKWDYVLETDYSSFESSFSWEYVQSVEIPFFEYFLQYNPLVLAIVKHSYIQNGKERIQKLFSKEFDLRLTGCRLSGELWTSLSNGFANLMNMLYLCDKKGIECQGFIEGDDGLFGMSSPALSKEDFANLGFSIKMEYVHQVQDTTFCGNTFSDTSLKLLINPENIGRVFWSCSAKYLKAKSKVLDSLFKSKAASLYVTGRYTPVAGTLAFKLLSRLSNVEFMPSENYWRHDILDIFRKIECKQPLIAYDDRLLYSLKFGLPISEQILLEKFIMSVPNCDDLDIPYCFMGNTYIAGLHV